jgi:O-antigen ligase
VGVANDIAAPETGVFRRSSFSRITDPTKGAFFWLSMFFVVYCARPEDWIPGLKYLPLAKITALFAMWSFYNSMRMTKRTLKDLPKEAIVLLILTGWLILGGFFSPIWKGGSVSRAIDYSKVFVAYGLIFLLITTFDRLRRVIFIQAASVAVIAAVSMLKGHDRPRLEGVIGGIYSNPNDLAFAIVLALPFALAFMVTTKKIIAKAMWACAMVIMMLALVLTASRAGVIDLICMGVVTLYHFGIRGRRFYLIVAAALVCVLVMSTAGGLLFQRFAALSGDSDTEESAYGSYEARMYLMKRAVEGISEYPVFGLGMHCFPNYSLIWHDVHMTYLQIAVEGGIPAFILYFMFFRRGFKNLSALLKTKNLDETTTLFVGALHGSLIGYAVGALFAPESYQFFPYFAVAFTSALLQTVKERQVESSPSPQSPKKPRHFLEAYANYGRAGAVSPVR